MANHRTFTNTGKYCSRCKTFKTYDEFNIDKCSASDHASQCRECKKVVTKDWHVNHPEKCAEYKRKWRYGITQEFYDSEYEKQGGKCAVMSCNRPITDTDHDHATDKYRGLLCHGCNTALGLLEDDIGRIEALAEYLESRYGGI